MKVSEKFALDQWLSDYPDDLSYAEILGLMSPEEEEDIWTHPDITPWHVVENFTLGQVAEFIDDTRCHFERMTS